MASSSTENASSSFSPSSSITPRRRYKYDAFVSFRGSDTRKKFTSHLFDALKRSGLTTFRDDETLERGASINPELLRAIEESRFAVVIFSSDYASSSWCLTELAKIVECMDKEKLTVLPVFYDVDPSDVRKLRGTFEDAFAKHRKDNTRNIQKWKDAVARVAGISGWDLRDEPESTVIKKIIRRICLELDRTFSGVSDHLVGMDSRVKEMLDLYLGEGLGGVRFVGICGMGGSGKTTLAREIYKRIAGDFEASSFIEDVRENTERNGLVSLQKQLCEILIGSETKIRNLFEGINVLGNRLCKKKVLIVLDDVDGVNQLEVLAGNCDWFGPGSRIIVTCRDRHLLSCHGVDPIYEAKGLNYDEALELFSWKAFNKPHPEENYVDLSKDFVKYANGIPLALKVLGSSLFRKGMDAFRCAQDKLKAELNPNILNVLKISFDGLEDLQKQMFLDIACFYKGKNIDCIRDILNSFGYYPDYNIGVLVEKYLITIDSKRTLWMHDLLQQLGREIVHRESPKELGRRSRLWKYEDVMHVLKNNVGTTKVEGIALGHEGRYHSWTTNHVTEVVEPMVDGLVPEEVDAGAFSRMTRLRYLDIGNVQLPQGLNYLSNELRSLKWHGFPLEELPTSFRPSKLVNLEMCNSRIKLLGKGTMSLDCLKFLDLSYSQNLIETPDFAGTPNLEKLLLSGCTRLSKIHSSVGYLNRLNLLDLNGCKRLESFPRKISMESLEIFDLGGCSKLKKFPEIVGNMSSVVELYLDSTAIEDLPFSIKQLTGLIKLDLSDCRNLSSLVNSTCSMTSLNTPTLSGSISKLHPKLDQIPKNLVNLKMCYSHVKQLWKGTVSSDCLKLIDLHDSQNFIETPDFTGTPNLEKLLFSGCTRLSKIHVSLGVLKRLKVLDLNGCKRLKNLPCKISLESLELFDLGGCSRLKRFPKIVGDMPHLTKLFLNNTAIENLPSSVKRFIGLIELDLNKCKNLSSLVDATCSLTSLKTLNLSSCPKLDQLPKNLGNLKSLEKLYVNGTAIIGLPSSFGRLKNLIILSLHKCQGLSTESLTPIGIVRSLSSLWSLAELDLSYCYLPAIPDIFGSLPFLGVLHLTGNNFVHLPKSITRLTTMIELYLNACMLLRSLPELPLNIRSIEANGCTSLETITLTPGNYFHPFLRFINCIKLIEYEGYGDMLLTMLRQYFQGKNDINLVIPGSEIPKWFSHQCVGASVNPQVPSDLRNKKLMGLAICAVFILHKHHSKKPDDHNCLQFLINGHTLNPSQYICQNFGKIESYHLFLRYLPLSCFDWIWKETLSQIDVNGSSQIEIRFFEMKGPGFEFKKCGAHLVFEQDIEDLNHDCEDSVKDTKIKRRRDDYDKDGPGPSGEGKSNGIDVPHPKRRRLSILIDKFFQYLGNWIRN